MSQPANASKDLLDQAVRASAWGYAGTVVKLAMQLGVQIWLARLLGPAEYGLFAVGVIVVAFAIYFGDVASSALIPRPSIDAQEMRFAITWQVLVNCAMAGILVAASGWLANAIHEPRAATVIAHLAPVCLFNAMGGVSLALLRRRLDFKTIQIAQVLGYFLGYVVVAIPYTLWVGKQVDALVAAWLVQAFATSAIYVWRAPHPCRPRLWCPSAPELLKFSAHSLVANLGNWLVSNVDRMVVARVFPVRTVGLYTTAANLMSTPLAQIFGTFQQVSFAATAKAETKSVGEAVAGMVATVAVLVGWMYAFALGSAHVLIPTLYGAKWVGAELFVMPFASLCFFQALSGVVSPVLWGRGLVANDAKAQFVAALSLLLLALALSTVSAIAIAWGAVAVSALRAAWLLRLIGWHFPEAASPMRKSLVRAVFFLVLTGLATRLAGVVATDFWGLPALAALLFSLSIGGSLLIAAFMQSRAFGPSFETAIGSLSSRLPKCAKNRANAASNQERDSNLGREE